MCMAQVVYTLPQGLDPDDALFSESGAMNIMFFMDKACHGASARVFWQTCTHSSLETMTYVSQRTCRVACPGPEDPLAATMHWQTLATPLSLEEMARIT